MDFPRSCVLLGNLNDALGNGQFVLKRSHQSGENRHEFIFMLHYNRSK